MQRTELDPMHSEGGFTLIEVIITVALISVAFVGILSAVGGLVLSGAENKSAATIQGVVKNVAANVQSYDTTLYLGCADAPTAGYTTGLDTRAGVPAGLHASITNVQFWNGDALSSTPGADGATFTGPGCPVGGDQGLERITVQVQTVGTGNFGGQFTKSLVVLKRNKP